MLDKVFLKQLLSFFLNKLFDKIQETVFKILKIICNDIKSNLQCLFFGRILINILLQIFLSKHFY